MPVSMICPANVRRSTMAAQRRGSVKVLVQPEKGSLLDGAGSLASSRNRRRRHSVLGMLTPIEYEQRATPIGP